MNINVITDFLIKDTERMASDLRSKYQAGMAEFKIEEVLEMDRFCDDHQKAKEAIRKLYNSIHVQIMDKQLANPDCLIIVHDVKVGVGEKIRMVVDCISVDIRNQRKRVLESAIRKMTENLLKD